MFPYLLIFSFVHTDVNCAYVFDIENWCFYKFACVRTIQTILLTSTSDHLYFFLSVLVFVTPPSDGMSLIL